MGCWEYNGEPDIVTDPKRLRMEMDSEVDISENNFWGYDSEVTSWEKFKNYLTVFT